MLSVMAHLKCWIQFVAAVTVAYSWAPKEYLLHYKFSCKRSRSTDSIGDLNERADISSESAVDSCYRYCVIARNNNWLVWVIYWYVQQKHSTIIKMLS